MNSTSQNVDASPASNPAMLGALGICQTLSDKSIGWAIRKIARVTDQTVELNDGVSFDSPCFAGARAGDIWAVCHEGGTGCFGRVRRAILLEPARDQRNQERA